MPAVPPVRPVAPSVSSLPRPTAPVTALPALVFDLDGVLVDSEPVKMGAFVDAVRERFDPSDHEAAAVGVYNGRQRGVPRSLKFEYVVRHILKRGDAEDVAALSARYSELLAERLPGVRLLPGVLDFLDAVPARRFVCSAAPEEEIAGHLARHAIGDRFEALFGYPVGKVQALRHVRALVGPVPVVLFGDAPADQAAAVATDVRFVPVNPTEHLQSLVGAWLTDFADVAAVRHLCGLPIDLTRD